jgi:hypothetical protein
MRRSFLALSLLFASALDALSAVPARAQAQVQDPSAVAWYAEAGAFAELGDDRDPLAGDAARRTTGLGAELRLGRPLAGFLDADAGLRLGGDVLRAGYVFGADLGVRVHPATFVAPFLGLRLGYTRIGGSFDDAAARGGAGGTGRTTQDGLHLRPELGLAIGRTDRLRVLLGVGLDYRLLNDFRAEDGDGLPLSRETSSLQGDGLAGATARLAVAIEL